MRSGLLLLFTAFFLYGCATTSVPTPEVSPAVFDPTAEAYERISAAMALGDPGEAIAEYEESLLREPDAVQTRVLLGNLYLAAGDTTSAEEVFLKVLEENPADSNALFGLSVIAGTRNDTAREQELLERAVEADPENTTARAALGEILLQLRRYKKAEEVFTEALQHDPDHLVALIGMGNLQLRTEKPEKAEAVLSRAIETAPDYSFSYADRSRALSMQYRLDEAENDLSTAIGLAEDYPWHRYDRGLVRLERNIWSGALEDFNVFIAERPDVFLAYVHRARAYTAAGDQEAAITDLETALALRPDFHPGFQPYGLLLFEVERFGEAARFFQRSWAEGNPADPRDPGVILLAALSWKLNGDDRKGVEIIEKAAGDLPQDTLYYEMARYLSRSRSGRRSDDARILNAVEKERDQGLRIRMKFYLAGQSEADGRTRSAVTLYREVMETELRGLPEIRLARSRYEALTQNRDHPE